MEHNIYIYIAVMALVTYAIRVLPLTLIRKEIKNPFIRFCLCSGYSRLQYSRRFFGRSFGDGAGSDWPDVGR